MDGVIRASAATACLLLSFPLLSWAGNEGTSSTFYGVNAGTNNVSAGAAGSNTFVGNTAGYTNTSGSENSFLGFDAGRFNTTGAHNTFLGASAGYANTTASDNSFVGRYAGLINSGGASNTFFGAMAGTSNSNGSDNTFLGTNAGYSNSTAGNNTFVGSGSGQYNTTGTGNTFVGTGSGVQNTVGEFNTFVGSGTGLLNTTGSLNTFVGESAGGNNNTGQHNTSLGESAGFLNIAGNNNTYLGMQAGSLNATGSNNVFVGYSAGTSETGSNMLYIDNCQSGGDCTSPFIYGEFDNHLLKVNGVLNVRANGVARSQMHFSKDDTDTGGWVTSVLDNNFFLSSGARFDATAGNWIQRSGDNRAVIAGSGSLGYRIFADSGQAVAANFTPTVRLHIDYNGNLGLNQLAVAGTPIMHSSGAHLTSGGVWTDASSREYKENIVPLTTEEALRALAGLKPVKFNYRVDADEKYVGFIAEDVPELVARKDRRSLSPMDIVAVLTQVVRDKSELIERQQAALQDLESRFAALEAKLQRLSP